MSQHHAEPGAVEHGPVSYFEAFSSTRKMGFPILHHLLQLQPPAKFGIKAYIQRNKILQCLAGSSRGFLCNDFLPLSADWELLSCSGTKLYLTILPIVCPFIQREGAAAL